MIAGLFGAKEGPPKTELLAEFQVWQNAQMVICDGAIRDVEFEKRIKELFLEYGVLNIDYWIALENLQQELLRLNSMTARVEYLLSEKARAIAFATMLYQDPGHRVLRDYYMELAQDSYDNALATSTRPVGLWSTRPTRPPRSLPPPTPTGCWACETSSPWASSGSRCSSPTASG